MSATEAREAAHAAPPTREWPLLLLLFALAAALSAVAILRKVNAHDEGLMLQAASRIADGQLPHRDFYWVYGPGQPLLLAGLEKIVGPSLLTWRILRVALAALVSVLAYLVARRSASRPLALGAFAAVAGAMASPALPHPNPAVLALGLGGILAARRSPVAAGALGGAAVFFHVQLGAAAALGTVIAAGAYARDRAAALRAAASAAAVAVLLLGPFALAGGLGRFLDQGLGFTLEAPGLKRPEFPLDYQGGLDPNKLLSFYFPLLLLVLSGLLVVLALRRRPPGWALAPAALAVGGLAYMVSRPDDFHLIPLAVALPLLLAAQAQCELDAGDRVTAAVLAVAIGVMALHGLDAKRVQATVPSDLAAIPVDVADGVREVPSEARALGELVPYVRARVPPGEPVFVANPRHDRLGLGNPLLYFLLQRPNPTHHDGLGLVTDAGIQREIVRDLRSARPEIAIRWLDPTAPQLRRGAPGSSPGARVLDRYLDRVYAPVRRFGDYVVLERRKA